MSHDLLAVIDDQSRVHRPSWLRVVDASIMPILISSNINALTIVIGEKAAKLNLAETGRLL
jgi:choline dehydrogenase